MRRLWLAFLLACAPPVAAQHAARDSALAKTLTAQSDTIFRDKGRPAYVERARLRVLAVADSLRRSKPDTVKLVRVDTVYVTKPDTTPKPPVGITVLPGQSIQAAVDANPTGTTFLLKSGTHVRQSVIPKDNDTFLGDGAGATILDGQSATTYAFNGYNGSRWVNGVTIKKLTVTKYIPAVQMGAVRAIDYDATNSTNAWTLDSVEVSYSKSIGVKAGNRMRVLRSNLHHNGTLNIGGSGVGILVDGTRSSDGNPGCANDPGFEAGGSKFALTDSLIVRNSTFTTSCGPGLWLDIQNKNYLLEGNRADSNSREGIVTEISYNGIIRNNSVSRNGWPVDPFRGNGWAWDAGIGVHASRDVEVYGNTLTENFNGIVAIQQSRGNGADGQPYLVQNLYVHDNTITQRTGSGCDGGWAGAAVQDMGDTAIFTSRNNRWVHNTYFIGGNPAPFAWMNGGCRTQAQWVGYGQDVTGTFNP